MSRIKLGSLNALEALILVLLLILAYLIYESMVRNPERTAEEDIDLPTTEVFLNPTDMKASSTVAGVLKVADSLNLWSYRGDQIYRTPKLTQSEIAQLQAALDSVPKTSSEEILDSTDMIRIKTYQRILAESAEAWMDEGICKKSLGCLVMAARFGDLSLKMGGSLHDALDEIAVEEIAANGIANYAQNRSAEASDCNQLLNLLPPAPDHDALLDHIESMIRSYFPALVGCLRERSCRWRCMRDATRVLLATRIYRAAHSGKLPTSKDELAPYLLSWPKDPFRNQPMIYDPVRQVVYSVGPNLVDDHGDLTRRPWGSNDVGDSLAVR